MRGPMLARHGVLKNNNCNWFELITRSLARSCKIIYVLFSFLFAHLSTASTQLPDDDGLTLQPDAPLSTEITIDNTESIHLRIDTKALEKELHGKIPIKFYSKNKELSFSNHDQENSELYWHKNNITFTEKGKSVETDNSDLINFRFTPTKDMVGKKVVFALEKEENLSKAAAVGALIPQMIPVAIMEAFNVPVKWAPHSFWDSMLHWNFLLLELDVIRSAKELIKHQVFKDQYSSRFAQCSADLVEGFIIYNAANHGHSPFKSTELGEGRLPAQETNRVDAFRVYLRSTPTNRMLDCISGNVADALKTLSKEGKLKEVFGNWSHLNTLNDKTLEGVAKLMVGYGFNLFVDAPAGLLMAIRSDLGLPDNQNIGPAFTNSLRTSIQYTIHNGYISFFKGRGWSDTSAYALASGAGVLEIGYRFYRLHTLTGIHNALDSRSTVEARFNHQMGSIGERSEAIVSSGFGLIPIPKDTLKHTATAAAVTLGAWAVFSAAAQTGWLNNVMPFGLNTSVQRVVTSGANGLVLGTLSYVLLPYIKKMSRNASQLAADQVVSQTKASKNSWIGYFAARDTQYKISVVVVE